MDPLSPPEDLVVVAAVFALLLRTAIVIEGLVVDICMKETMLDLMVDMVGAASVVASVVSPEMTSLKCALRFKEGNVNEEALADTLMVLM